LTTPAPSSPAESGLVPPSSVRGIAGQVVANTSLLVAVLVYMGWAYDSALFGYFHVSPLDLDVGVIEYMLRSLALFSPALVIAATSLIGITAARTWNLDWAKLDWAKLDWAKLASRAGGETGGRIRAAAPFRWLAPAGPGGPPRSWRGPLTGAGAAVTVTAIVLAWSASYIPVGTYLVLVLLGGGPLLLTWPARAGRHGRFPYALAVILAAVCALWAASLYANNLGVRAAQQLVRDLPERTAVAVYSVQPLALAGPGVTVQQLPAAYEYHYRYLGLRLLTTRSGTYYLLPVGWDQQHQPTYIVSETDPAVRIELY
jgi:hypothetical protein